MTTNAPGGDDRADAEPPGSSAAEPAPAADILPPPGTPDPVEGIPDPVYRAADVVDPASVRRAPRYSRFAVTGLLLGLLAAAVLALLPVPDPFASAGTLMLVLGIVLGGVGALVGLLVAVLAERRSLRGRERR
jgi:hypothetical protein